MQGDRHMEEGRGGSWMCKGVEDHTLFWESYDPEKRIIPRNSWMTRTWQRSKCNPGPDLRKWLKG